MKLGVPVVATPIAVEGMFARDGVDCLVADSAEAFAQRIVQLHADCELWRGLVEGGVQNVRDHFSVDIARRVLLEVRPAAGGAWAERRRAVGAAWAERGQSVGGRRTVGLHLAVLCFWGCCLGAYAGWHAGARGQLMRLPLLLHMRAPLKPRLWPLRPPCVQSLTSLGRGPLPEALRGTCQTRLPPEWQPDGLRAATAAAAAAAERE